MPPAENELLRLVAEWLRKADLDFNTVVRLGPEEAFRYPGDRPDTVPGDELGPHRNRGEAALQ